MAVPHDYPAAALQLILANDLLGDYLLETATIAATEDIHRR